MNILLISYNLQASERHFQKTMKKREGYSSEMGKWKLTETKTAFPYRGVVLGGGFLFPGATTL